MSSSRRRAANGTTTIAVLLLLLLSIAHAAAPDSPAEEEEDLLTIAWPSSSYASRCRGLTLAECIDADDDLSLDPDDANPHRRMLYPLRYISYGALKRDTVPCSVRGASYYNCRPGAQANPYYRGCSAIARCRRY